MEASTHSIASVSDNFPLQLLLEHWGAFSHCLPCKICDTTGLTSSVNHNRHGVSLNVNDF